MKDCVFCKGRLLAFRISRGDSGYVLISNILFSGSRGALFHFPGGGVSLSRGCRVPRNARIVFGETFRRDRVCNKIVLPSSLGLVRSTTFSLESVVPASNCNRH